MRSSFAQNYFSNFDISHYYIFILNHMLRLAIDCNSNQNNLSKCVVITQGILGIFKLNV